MKNGAEIVRIICRTVLCPKPGELSLLQDSTEIAGKFQLDFINLRSDLPGKSVLNFSKSSKLEIIERDLAPNLMLSRSKLKHG